MKRKLTVKTLCKEAKIFADIESTHSESALYGVTDGKAVGTYFEHKFQAYLQSKYLYDEGSSAKGIDFPTLEVDMKVTSVKQPQSSSPFESARQKVFGLGYSLLVFVYEKTDDSNTATGTLDIIHTIFVEKARTADYQITRSLLQILETDGNEDDIIAFLYERNLPIDDISSKHLAREIIKSPPEQGYLTISNALQWRLQYSRVIQEASNVEGIIRVR